MSGEDEERRSTRRRRGLEEHGIVSARVRPGSEAELIDVSAGGALIETVHRMLPGAAIELQLQAAESRTAIRGRVTRCAVARLRAGAIWYRGAIVFDRHLPWFVDERRSGSGAPHADTRLPRHGREDAASGIQ
jgi:hypothetical protein